VLVTDHSSCAFEYMLLDRPIVRIDLPELIAQANVHADYVRLLAGAAIGAPAEAGAVVRAVEHALASPAERGRERRAAAADLFYLPGSATERCAAALYEAMRLAPAAVAEREPCVA
jgi:CDP-glycerol glycerophosphotransferase (TagB/SpsB family)